MSIFENIVNHFNAHIDSTASSIESLTPYIAEAAHLCGHVLIENKKIFCIGSKHSQPIVQQLCNNLLVNSEMERPSLPALNLENNLSSTLLENNYAQQIQSLASQGDLLLILATEGNEIELMNALQCAKNNSMNIILINAGNEQKLAELIPEDMVKIQLPILTKAHSASLQFLIIQLLSELIERQLFAGFDE